MVCGAMNINLELTREDVGTLVTALGWMAEDLGILQRAGEDDTADNEPKGPEPSVEAEIQSVRDLCAHLYEKLEESHVEDE